MNAKKLVALSPMLVLLVSADASAHPAPYAHRHVAAPSPVYTTVSRQESATVTRRVRRVIVHGGPVIEVQDEQALVVEQPAPVIVTQPRRQVIIEEPESLYAPKFSVGLRGSLSALDGSKIGLSDAENPVMGGVGLAVRTRFTDSVGLELSVDYMEGRGRDFTQNTVPLSLSLDYHFLPRIRFQPYVLGGLSVDFTELKYLDGKYKYDLVELGGHLGAGLELFLTRDISLHADLRGNMVFKNLDSQAQIRDDCIARNGRNGEMAGFCDNVQSADPGKKINMGIQVMAGLSYHF
jgi:opacity protein-like surface antigen